MKIIHIVLGKANPERMNGVNRVVHALATEMARRKQDVEVWGITKTPDEKTVLRPYPLHLFEGNGRSFGLSPLLIEALDALPADVCLHFHGVLISQFVSIARHLRRRGIRWVVTPHGAYMPASLRRNRLVKTLFIHLCDRFLLRYAFAIHVITDAEKTAVERLVRGVPCITIANGYAGDATLSLPAVHGIYRKNRPVFGYMGRLDQVHKGLDILIAGFYQYIKKGGRGDLWLLGNGPHRDALERAVCAHNMESRVRFWDARYGDEKTTVLMNMDVFLHTSRWDVAPTAVLEAAAHGRPLVISPETGLGDAVVAAQSGFVLEHNDPADVARIMALCDTMMATNQLEKMGEQAQNMIRTTFNWTLVVDRLMQDVYPVRKKAAA
jgi:glycosyltransferase involved in cell wall biosynthesis